MTVLSIEDRRVELSLRRLAETFGVSRDLVSKRLAEHNVKPCGMRGGFPVYRLRDAAPAILSLSTLDDNGDPDPSKMKPTDRHAFFKAENERLRYEVETGKLMIAAEVEFEMRTLVAGVVKALETLPDRCERDTRCAPEVTEFLIEQVRAVRAEMAANLRAEVIAEPVSREIQ